MRRSANCNGSRSEIRKKKSLQQCGISQIRSVFDEAIDHCDKKQPELLAPL